MTEASGRRVVVVDGSNLATEGRTTPSLRQLDEAVQAYGREDPDAEIVVVVDATFEHRIDPSQRQELIDAELHGEVVSPPAGAIGRGDAFVLRIAERTGARVLSNDSFQEFHAEHPWLFDEGRLIGGKPVPGIGWIFTPRVPVRGPKSRQVTGKKKRGGALSPPVKAAELARAAKKVAERKLPAAMPDGSPPKVGDVWPAGTPNAASGAVGAPSREVVAPPPEIDGAEVGTPSTGAAETEGVVAKKAKKRKASTAKKAAADEDETAIAPGAGAEEAEAPTPAAKKAGAKKAASKKAPATAKAAKKKAAAAKKAVAKEAATKETPATATAAKKKGVAKKAAGTKEAAAEKGAAKKAPTSKRVAKKAAGTADETAIAPGAGAEEAEAPTPAAKKAGAKKAASKKAPATAKAAKKKAAAAKKTAAKKAAAPEEATAKEEVAKKVPTSKRVAKQAARREAGAGAIAQGEVALEEVVDATTTTTGAPAAAAPSELHPARAAAREDPVVKDAIDQATVEALSPVPEEPDGLAGAERGSPGKAGTKADGTKKKKGKAGAREAKQEGKKADKRSRRRSAAALPAVNEPLVFINFVVTYPLESEIEGEVVSFTSHGAMVDIDLPDGGLLHSYIPLTAMGNPPPTKARQVLTKGERRSFVLVGLDPQRRVAELALPGVLVDAAEGAD